MKSWPNMQKSLIPPPAPPRRVASSSADGASRRVADAASSRPASVDAEPLGAVLGDEVDADGARRQNEKADEQSEGGVQTHVPALTHVDA